MDLDAAVRDIVARTFAVSAADISDATRRGALEQWDSLGHINLLEALRKQFGVELDPETALDIESVADLKRVLGGRKLRGLS